MIGGIGVGGIEAEAALLGQPINMSLPVVGVSLEGATATDLVLHITEKLREVGVVDKFVEFYGPGVSQLSVADRATIANMAPNRARPSACSPSTRNPRVPRTDGSRPRTHRPRSGVPRGTGPLRRAKPEFTEVVEFDLGEVEPSLAGHKKPTSASRWAT